jgi:two-component system OmpR family response regulator
MASVLVVDDEPDIRLIARVVLTSAGHAVEEAASAAEALACVETHSGDHAFDAIVLDVRLPDMDGWQVLGRLREGGCDVPVVFFTADVRVNDDLPTCWRDSDQLVKKPFKPDALLAAVTAALGSGDSARAR